MSPQTGPARLAVVGAGAWGTVIAGLLGRNGHAVTLWARREELAMQIREHGRNDAYAPGFALGPNVRATADAAEAVDGAAAVFLAVPSVGLRGVLEMLAAGPSISAVVSCAKGIEVAGFRRFSEVIAAHLPRSEVGALSGPNLAGEIAAGMPAAATIASPAHELAARTQAWLQQPRFRVYRSTDLVGVEIAGAMKNVVALAAGMSDGLRLGDNARAGIITRGLAETVRFGVHLGGEPRTFYGLAGVGDMVATCTSAASRNHTAGVRIATGSSLADLERDRLNAEGIPTVRAVVAHARRHGIEMPISVEVYRVMFDGKDPERALNDLMTRDLKPE